MRPSRERSSELGWRGRGIGDGALSASLGASTVALCVLLGACSSGSPKAEGARSAERTTTTSRARTQATTTSTTTVAAATTTTAASPSRTAGGSAPPPAGPAAASSGAPPCASGALAQFGLEAGGEFSEAPGDEPSTTVAVITAQASGQGVCLVAAIFLDDGGSPFGQYVLIDEEDAFVAFVEPSPGFELTPRIVSCYGPSAEVAATLVNAVAGTSYPPQACT